MSEPWQHFYQSQRLRLAYWTWGSAANPPLILVHGGRDHSRNWDKVAEAFRDEYHVIACDLRGHGDSQWATGAHYALPDHILDLRALVDLFGGQARVIGHSFGGAISLLTAGAFPERFEKIVCIEGTGARMDEHLESMNPERMRKWAMRTRGMEQQTPRIYSNFESTVDRVQEANKALTREMAEHLARWGTHSIDGGWVWKFDPWVRGRTPVELSPEEMTGFWGNIECPVLNLIGSQSEMKRSLFMGKPLDSYFEDSRTQVIQDAGHWIHHDQTDAAITAIRDFLGPPPPPRPLD
ncbi:MAG: alpha/beta hydrolase [Chloroflexi bacterium]|nr:alpha/beta hydrolase [Chloroflexota bacterium]MDA1240368.1 alpha/beta hydrolase [Chloroflexota bacterium]